MTLITICAAIVVGRARLTWLLSRALARILAVLRLLLVDDLDRFIIIIILLAAAGLGSTRRRLEAHVLALAMNLLSTRGTQSRRLMHHRHLILHLRASGSSLGRLTASHIVPLLVELSILLLLHVTLLVLRLGESLLHLSLLLGILGTTSCIIGPLTVILAGAISLRQEVLLLTVGGLSILNSLQARHVAGGAGAASLGVASGLLHLDIERARLVLFK